MYSLNHTLSRQAWLAPLAIRVILGSLFILHGIDKFNTGISDVEGFFAVNGVPASALTAPLVAIAEAVLGTALLAGLATRVSAALLGLILAGAIIFVKADVGILGGAETDLAYIAGLVTLTLIGPGRVSVDEALKMDDTVIDIRSAEDAQQRTTAGV